MRSIFRGLLPLACLAGLLALSSSAFAADWLRFRGPNGSGVCEDKVATPAKWSPTENLQWKIPLPGPGSSCPIVVGDKVFVTCWSGYGMTRGGNPGNQSSLRRHLICLERDTGKTVWDKAVDPYLPEDNYGGMFAEHGYATHTPVSDGKRIYVFFGKTGAMAFDLEGKELWKTPLGTGSDRMGWGSGSSPILYKDLVICLASPESQSLVALNKETGKEVWRSKANGYGGTWGTPIVMEVDDKRTDIVVGVPYEIWAVNPETGKMRWFCEALSMRSFCSSVITDGKNVYAMGDQGSGAIAVKGGGEKDVTKTHVAWTATDSNRVGTPVLVDGKIYSVSNRVVTCLDAKSGDKVFQGRLDGGSSSAAPAEGEGRPMGGFGGRGGRGGQDYSSPVVADGKLYYLARNGDGFVVKLGDTFEQLGTNRVTTDSEDFSATPAISNGQIFIRSSKHVYCVADTAKKAEPKK